MDTQQVLALINEALEVNTEIFLLEYNISQSGDIQVIVDGDKSVPLEECIRISRHIEHNLDRESNDFSLVVTTPDITKPIADSRQYKKNIGRILKIETTDLKIEGTLLGVDAIAIELEYQTREPKPIGKGKHTVQKNIKISFEDIKKATVKIVYN